jgi:membrane protease YdiL (CAAX protease family)
VKTTVPLSFLAAGLFVPLFVFRRFGPIDFWWWMSANIAILVSLCFIRDKSYWPLLVKDLRERLTAKIVIGSLSALVLYLIFLAGNELSRSIFHFAAKGIGGVYSFKDGASISRIFLLIVLLIGPGEEVFWRGFLQRHWSARAGTLRSWLGAAAFYAAVHAGSGNIMLVLAALVCGLYWGALYARYRSALLIAVSHTLWDVLIFLVLPFG